MNLDELKGAWSAYDDQLKSTKDIDDQVIAGMIRKRSVSAVANIRKSYLYGIFACCFYLLAIGALNLGNPFDYTHDYEQIPLQIMFVALLLILFVLLKARASIKELEFPEQSLLNYLENVIKEYCKTWKILDVVIYFILFSTCILFPLSFLSRSIARLGLWPALFSSFSLLIFIVVSNVVTYVIARKKGGVKRSWYSFSVIIKELEELKAMASELKNS
ncbi:hypothetical protein [Pedobacter caeni]|uniref:Uncharacterized protein n=1 Tax=Pedobacter caeni TaxID=288992 RepID=A0A1M5DF16_9SPHI|nr:hypothetical protein [Pedobacter caeni]SHF65444.1 hypothetical protein SAMN04488522_103200 [Pedobacter caeni]